MNVISKFVIEQRVSVTLVTKTQKMYVCIQNWEMTPGYQSSTFGEVNKLVFHMKKTKLEVEIGKLDSCDQITSERIFEFKMKQINASPRIDFEVTIESSFNRLQIEECTQLRHESSIEELKNKKVLCALYFVAVHEFLASSKLYPYLFVNPSEELTNDVVNALWAFEILRFDMKEIPYHMDESKETRQCRLFNWHVKRSNPLKLKECFAFLAKSSFVGFAFERNGYTLQNLRFYNGTRKVQLRYSLMKEEKRYPLKEEEK